MSSLSVVIPTYNRAALLAQTLESLTRQSCSDFQTIVVDHGSTDQTAEVARHYQQRLQLSYYHICHIPHDAFAPGVPRDFGVRKVRTSLTVTLDTGVVVPSCYIQAHLTFHRHHCRYVGIGLASGLLNNKEGTEEVIELSQSEIDQVYEQHQNPRWRDVREGIDLEHCPMPWYYGWTANLSMPTQAYLDAGGTDVTLTGWGFEDVDLCYRLYKQGLRFAFVPDGWGLELPQERQPMRERIGSGRKNLQLCYDKQRSLALESLLLSSHLLRESLALYRALPTTTPDTLAAIGDYMRSHFQFFQYAEAILSYLSELGQKRKAVGSLPKQVQTRLGSPTLCIGGTSEDVGRYDYVTLADESHVSQSSVWSCCGVELPLADQTLDTVVVSDIWQRLDWALPLPAELPRVSLLDCLLEEIHRTAKRAVFLHTPSSACSTGTGCSIEALTRLCQRHQLAFQVVSVA